MVCTSGKRLSADCTLETWGIIIYINDPFFNQGSSESFMVFFVRNNNSHEHQEISVLTIKKARTRLNFSFQVEEILPNKEKKKKHTHTHTHTHKCAGESLITRGSCQLIRFKTCWHNHVSRENSQVVLLPTMCFQ